MLPKLKAGGHRVLMFSQMTRVSGDSSADLLSCFLSFFSFFLIFGLGLEPEGACERLPLRQLLQPVDELPMCVVICRRRFRCSRQAVDADC